MKRPAETSLWSQIEGAIERYRLLRARDSVLVAVSGGPDSVALLATLVGYSRPGWRIGVGHVNHHLRGKDSDRDQRFVERLAKRLGCEVFVADEPISGAANLEERARERRYAALAAIAGREGFRRIATAHTLDDQAETVLHRLLRGTGTAGLAAIARSRADGVIRPMLDSSREDVKQFLRSRRLRHRVDRTNASERFTRNRLRRRVLPLLEREVNPAVKRALARLADLARDDEALLEEAASRRSLGARKESALDARAIGRLPSALRRRALRQWLASVRGHLRGIELEHVAALDDLATGGREGQRLSLPGGTASRRNARLLWNFAAADEARWRVATKVSRKPVAPGRWRAVFDADLLAAPLRIRRTRPGDRVRPLGLGGTKKLQDVFIDAKVPRDARSSWPIVEDARGLVVWVPGLVRGDAAPIGRTTARYLVVEASR